MSVHIFVIDLVDGKVYANIVALIQTNYHYSKKSLIR